MRITGFAAIVAAFAAVWIALANPDPIVLRFDAVDPENGPKLNGSAAIFMLASFALGALFGGLAVGAAKLKGFNLDRFRKLRRAAAED